MQPKYGYGDDGDAGANVPAGATLSVELEVVSWYDVEDVSTDKDGGVLMTKIVESAEANDYKNPKDMGTAKMHLKVTLEDGTVVKDTRADNGDEPVSHQLDETIPICPAVEMALKKMKKGGHSKLKISPKHGFGDGNAELGVPGGATVLAEIELLEFENEKDSWDLSEDDKLETADKKKQQGNQKLKAGDLARAMRRYESAKSVLASDYKMDDDQKEKAKAMKVAIFTNMAVVEAKLGNQEAVFKNCEEALKLDENCVKALFRRGSIYSKRTDFDRAQADFDKLLSVDPDNAPVKKELALLKKRVAKETAKSKKQFGGMFDKMAASDKKKQKLNPPAPEPAPEPAPAPAPPPEPLNLAEEDAGEEDGEVPTMEEALEQFNGGDSVQAARAFTRIVKDDEDNSEAWRLLGQCHADNDDDRKAVRCLAASVDKDPSNLKALAAIGVAYFNERLTDLALDHLRKWVDNHPEYKALSDEKATGVDEVAEMYKKVVKQGAEDPEPRVVLGVLYNLSQEYDDAADVLREASRQAPNDYTLWNKLGATLANCGNAQEALYAYQHAVDLRPKYIRGHVNLGMAYQNQSRCEPFQSRLLGPVRLI